MKYFTRNRYLAIQSGSAKASRDWGRAGSAYARHLEVLRNAEPSLPDTLLALDLHDGVIKAVQRISDAKRRIVVDASNNPWGARGWFSLVFSGVRTFSARGPIVGDWWLYNEIHRASAGFSLHVLLHRSSLIVTASKLDIQTMRGAD